MTRSLATNLTDSDRSRLNRFRITDELIELHEIHRVTDNEARLDCGILARNVSDLSGVVYPIFGADDQVKGYRVRRDNPEIRKGKPENKYVMSVDRPHLYFERTSRQYISNASVPLILVESYTATLAISAWCQRTGQLYMVVATAGCWGWSGTIGITENENGQRVQEKGLSPDFALIALEQRTVFILFDSDVSSNYKVSSARRRLTAELHELNALVRYPVIPQNDGVKLGPDDYLALFSDEDFAVILDKAKTARKYETPFRLTEDAVLCRVEKENKETGEKEISWPRVCSYLDVDAETRDDHGENWGRLLVVKDRDGNRHEWAMPMSMLAGDGTAYREILLSLGLEIEPGKFAKDCLQQYISKARPDQKARCVFRIGWHGTSSGSVYVLPDATFATSTGERVLLQSAWAGQHPYQSSGTLADWRDNVAVHCIGNSRLVTTVSAAFAPPLMRLVDEPGGGLHLRGPSSTGKTTALHLAGSVWGGSGIEGFIRSWRATGNGLEAIAAQHNDALLCLDELSQVDSREAGETAYMLANGSGKNRARRDGSSRVSAEWRVLFLSTGENSLADKMSETSRQASAGQEVRLVDIPADAGCSLGIFENLHGFSSADIFARALRDNALKYYGTPIRAFLEKLAADPESIAKAIAKAKTDFVNRYIPVGAAGQVSRVGNRFALIAAAGTLATAVGILPWPPDEVVNAVARCFQDWLEQRGTFGNQESITAIRQVRKFFELHGESRFADWENPNARPTINRAGFRRKKGADDVEFFVFPEVFRVEICAGLNSTFVAKELLDKKFLIPDASGKRQRSERLPDIGTKRVYHLTSAILEGVSDD